MKALTAVLLPLALFAACGSSSSPTPADNALPVDPSGQIPELSGLSTAHFAEGCFWCAEEVFESVKGVKEVISGYSGGTEKNPTYEEVSSGRTGHAESIEVYFDPEVVSFETLVKVFFASQDPTTPDRQGPDAGAQAVGQHKTSMLQDVEAGRQLELQALVGAVIELGQITDTPTPTINAVYALTSLLAKNLADHKATLSLS